MTAAELVARLADRGVVLAVRCEALSCRGPHGALTPDLVAALREKKEEILDLLRRDRFTRAELDAMGFKGTRRADGAYEVRVGGAIEILLLRLGLFGVGPEIRGDELWLVGRTPADDPEVLLPAKLLAEAKARAEEIDRHVRAMGVRDAK